MNDRLSHALNHCKSNTSADYIYAISDGEFVKIGIAADVPLRLAQLQVGNARQLAVMVAWQSLNAFEDEQGLHGQIAKYHIRGEWFEQTPQVIAAIANAVTGALSPKHQPPRPRRKTLKGYWARRPYR